MKKLLLILICLPLIGYSQFGKYTSDGQLGIYWNMFNYPGNLGNKLHLNITPKSADESLILDRYYLPDSINTYQAFSRSAIGAFYNFESSLVFNHRINIAADYFYYGPSTGIALTTDYNKAYFRLTTGVGIPLYYRKASGIDFNINNIAYIGEDIRDAIDINLTCHVSAFLRVIVGYETSPRLSGNFKGFYLSDNQVNPLEGSENYVQFPNFYISVALAISGPTGVGAIPQISKNGNRIPWDPFTGTNYALKPTKGCIKGNCKNGKGVYVDFQGRYKGRFKNGKHNGQGVMSFADGSSYDGEWRMGEKHGKGTYISKYTEELSGDWVDDEFADPKLKPELVIRNLVVKDSDGNDFHTDDEIYAEESGKINFYIENIGEGNAYNIVFAIKDLNNINGLEVGKRIRIEKLKSGDKKKISIPVTSNLDLKTGFANIKISSEELNGFPPDDFSISFKTLAYINPDLKIIDHHFSSGEKGKNKLMVNDRAVLSFIVQNIGQGIAQDVVINLGFTSHENIFTGDPKLFNFKSLSPNESQTITFEFFTNKNFNKETIGISVNVEEKFNKYGDSKVLSQEIGKEIQSNQSVHYDGGNIRKEVVIDNLSLTSLVDKNIPTNSKVNNRFALVIGNEDYQSKQRGLSTEQNVDYAVNDAKIFKEYALKTLGVKEDNMFFLKDATATELNREIKLVSKIIKKLGSKAELIVYYAGHGYPDETTKVPYLIPVDVPASDLNYAIKLDDFYKDLSATGAKKITVFLDACFTGGGRESGLMASRGVKVKPKQGTFNGNIVVFSASSEEQSALPYHKEGHGMFTYYLLKKLQESKGKVSMGALADYIKDQVSIQSLKINRKEQDPVINTSGKVQDSWRGWGF